jgi:magnesium chelatase family protein
MFLGELSLDGSLRHTNGILPMVAMARRDGFNGIIVPASDAGEAAMVEGARILPFDSLAQLVGYLRGELEPCECKADAGAARVEAEVKPEVDLAHVKGQEHVKRALEVAAAGGHNVIMCGPPGSGKTMLARSLPGILPLMTNAESLEVTKIYSVSGLLPPGTSLIRRRPFRAPHYTISNAGLVGGGHWPRPGEVSLSHRGVLFLDELPEFGHSLLEILRQPLEDKNVTISRARGSLTFPASFMLVGAMNPCPCGYYGDAERACTCSAGMIQNYRKRISGPLLDRIDIHVEVPAVAYRELRSPRDGSDSATLREAILRARHIQRERFGEQSTMLNGRMGSRLLRKHCGLDDASERILQQALTELGLSARAHDKILRVARTIADLEGQADLRPEHVSEAIMYRRLDRQL